jgi:hypothetical protein
MSSIRNFRKSGFVLLRFILWIVKRGTKFVPVFKGLFPLANFLARSDLFPLSVSLITLARRGKMDADKGKRSLLAKTFASGKRPLKTCTNLVPRLTISRINFNRTKPDFLMLGKTLC